MSKQANNRQLNCAIYTRKSTDEGLDKDFNTLDAQRECAEAYIKSQTQEGWHCVPDRYDDGGFTGGNMDRPALKQMLADKVSEIYILYLEKQSIMATIAELDQRGWHSKSWQTRKGTYRGGSPFTKATLFRMLTNVTYIGKLGYKDEINEGEQDAIITM